MLEQGASSFAQPDTAQRHGSRTLLTYLPQLRGPAPGVAGGVARSELLFCTRPRLKSVTTL